MEVQVGDVAAQADQFGLLHLFWIASPVVKIVMIGLVVASIICWAIVFEKYMAVRKMHRSIEKFEQMFWSGQSLEDLYLTLGPRTNKGMASSSPNSSTSHASGAPLTKVKPNPQISCDTRTTP